MVLQEITKEATVFPGDVIEMHYELYANRILALWQETQIEKALENQPNFFLYSIRDGVGESAGLRIFTVHVIEESGEEGHRRGLAGFPLAAVIITISAAIASIFIFASLHKVFKVVKTPAGAVMGAGFGIAAAAAVALFFVLRK